MSLRLRLILLLLPLTALSFWIIYEQQSAPERVGLAEQAVPDYTMTQVNSLRMDAGGRPKSRLTADFLAHFESGPETELTRPQLELFRPQRLPLYVRADQGWVKSGNEVILLHGNVRFWELDATDDKVFEVTTSEAIVYPEQDMAETDKAATLTTPQSRTDSVGMRAYLNEDRIEMLSRVRTVINNTDPDR